jgi:hypothetical protein
MWYALCIVALFLAEFQFVRWVETRVSSDRKFAATMAAAKPSVWMWYLGVSALGFVVGGAMVALSVQFRR